MEPIAGTPVLTAAAMRAAEERAIVAGTSVAELMARAGRGVAEAVRRLAAGAEVLVLCGPGNNGGDGYVAARVLREAGVAVRVAASGEPKGAAAIEARAGWSGPVESLDAAAPAPVLVDALFGTGLTRPLDPALADALARLASHARLAIAVDLPSGVATDSGACLSPVPCFDLTLALGAVKPAHLLQPAAERCGQVRLIDIGVAVDSDCRVLASPALPDPGPESHKYSRGMVAVVAGAMPGAAALASEAAARAGAGYVLLLGSSSDRLPHSVVRRRWSADALGDLRIGAILVGPGLGQGDGAAVKLDAALASGRPLVIDGDALALLKEGDRLSRVKDAILTPHAGEFARLFGKPEADKLSAARAAAARSGAVVVFKGSDTVIAAPDGRVRLAEPSNPWLSTAGTGDVLAGPIAACRAAGLAPLDAAAAGVWLHDAAASRLGRAFNADDLPRAIGRARAAL